MITIGDVLVGDGTYQFEAISLLYDNELHAFDCDSLNASELNRIRRHYLGYPAGCVLSDKRFMHFLLYAAGASHMEKTCYHAEMNEVLDSITTFCSTSEASDVENEPDYVKAMELVDKKLQSSFCKDCGKYHDHKHAESDDDENYEDDEQYDEDEDDYQVPPTHMPPTFNPETISKIFTPLNAAPQPDASQLSSAFENTMRGIFSRPAAPPVAPQQTVQQPANKSCACCGNTTKKLQHCGACKKVYYCSKECQKKHWNDHKKFCKK